MSYSPHIQDNNTTLLCYFSSYELKNKISKLSHVQYFLNWYCRKREILYVVEAQYLYKTSCCKTNFTFSVKRRYSFLLWTKISYVHCRLCNYNICRVFTLNDATMHVEIESGDNPVWKKMSHLPFLHWRLKYCQILYKSRPKITRIIFLFVNMRCYIIPTQLQSCLQSDKFSPYM